MERRPLTAIQTAADHDNVPGHAVGSPLTNLSAQAENSQPQIDSSRIPEVAKIELYSDLIGVLRRHYKTAPPPDPERLSPAQTTSSTLQQIKSNDSKKDTPTGKS